MFVVPGSLDGGDFSRLFHDVTGNALFTDVMMPMASQGMLGAPVCTFVFTKMTSNQNAPNETKEGIRSPFTPAQAVQKQMGDLAASLREAAQHHPLLQASIRGYTSPPKLQRRSRKPSEGTTSPLSRRSLTSR